METETRIVVKAPSGRVGCSASTRPRSLSSVIDPRQRLGLMLQAAFQAPRARSLHAALAEAGEDPIVKRVLKRVASARIEYLEACYGELGLSQSSAREWAVFAYSAYPGLLQLAHEAPTVLPDQWTPYAELLGECLVPPRAPDEHARKTSSKKVPL